MQTDNLAYHRLKGLVILKFLLIVNCSLFGQETKFISKITSEKKNPKEAKVDELVNFNFGLGQNFIEEYYVMSVDENIRHGTYLKYKQTFKGIQVLESGSFQNGQKSGPWEYYYDIPMRTVSSIKEKGHYVNGKKNGVWTGYYMDTIPELIKHETFGHKRKIDSIKVSIKQQSARIKIAGMYLNDKRIGEWVSFSESGNIFQIYNFSRKRLMLDPSVKDTSEYNGTRNALFVGGLTCFEDLLAYEFSFTTVDLREGIKSDSTAATVSFTIDEKGSVIAPKIESTTGNKLLENEALRIVALLDNQWIPAVKEGRTVSSIYKIHFFFVRKQSSRGKKGFLIGYKLIFD
jgi:hypothetical protein